MADPTILVQPPARKPRKGGIRTALDFREEPRLFLGALPNYDALPCSLTVGEIELCYVDVTVPDKETEGIDVATGILPTFGGYVGVECFVGPWDDYADRARDTLEQSEDRVIERALSAWLDDQAASVTGGADWASVIGALEQAADENYVGQPIIYLNRADAAEAASQLAVFPDDSYDGRIWTANGTPVVAGFAFAAGQASLTGSATVLHSEISVSEGLDITHNRNMAIAERAYNLIIDCDYAIKALITTP